MESATSSASSPRMNLEDSSGSSPAASHSVSSHDSTTRKSRECVVTVVVLLIIIGGSIGALLGVVSSRYLGSDAPHVRSPLPPEDTTKQQQPATTKTTTTPSSPSPTTIATSTPSISNREYLMELILAASPETSFDDENSATSQALTWLELDTYSNDDSTGILSDENRLLQRFALATFWFSAISADRTTTTRMQTRGSSSEPEGTDSSWIQPTNECVWEGVQCSENVGVVQHLVLASAGLFGTIPKELTILSSLSHLDLHNNALYGSLPSQMGQRWSNLEYLDVAFNILSATLPTEVGQLQRLTTLRLFWNFFSGTIPNQLGFLPNMTFVALGNNWLDGSLPQQPGWGRSLTSLSLEDNYLGGTLPASVVAGWTILKELRLENNQFHGQLPSTEVGQSWSSIEHLDLSYNSFEGPLPSEMGLWTSLTVLHLSNNLWTGQIPSEISLLSDNLRYAFLDSNDDLWGTIPSSLCAGSLHWAEVDCSNVLCDCCFDGDDESACLYT